MSLGRHARHYLLIGGVQWLVDWGVMVLLSHYGMLVELANVLGRVAGALLGYWLNGKLTFAGDDTAIGRKQLARFILMWLGTTAISTWSMGVIDRSEEHTSELQSLMRISYAVFCLKKKK